MSIDIRGILEFYRHKKITLMLHDDGRRMTDSEARKYLHDALAEGKRVLPTTNCDNFDYQKGCQGHQVSE